MTHTEITQKIIKKICDRDANLTEQLVSSATLNDNGLDSIDIVQLIIDLEKEFRIGVPDDDAEGWDDMSIDELAVYIKSKIA